MPASPIRSLLAASAIVLAGPVTAATILPPIVHGDRAIVLNPVATGLSAPDYATFAPGDPTRLFVVEQGGLLRVLQNGVLQAAPALDISGRVSPPFVPTNANDERGFLGLAFHPDFNNAAAAEINWLVDHVRWDIEEDLARLLGDERAHGLVQLSRPWVLALQGFVRSALGATPNRNTAP